MKLTYLGTAAAEGFPAVWCNCDACNTARKLGAKDIRTRNQIMIDGDTLFDFPPDTLHHAIANRLNLSGVKYLFITHTHADHFYPEDLDMRANPFSHGTATLHAFGNKAAISRIKKLTSATAKTTLQLTALKPYNKVQTDGGYVIAIPAVHKDDEDSFVYIINRNGKTALIFNDSARLPQGVHDRIAEMGIKLDLISFDCTYGGTTKATGGRHMGMFENRQELDEFIRRGVADEATKCVVTHFSHNCNSTHEQLQHSADQYGFTVAYDGMTVEI